ncbi:hypothetical protein CCL17_23060, partial [Pseudomonas congelans]
MNGTIVTELSFLTLGHDRYSCGRLSFLTLQRGNALGDAPRHRSAPRCTIRIGRRASRNACP